MSLQILKVSEGILRKFAGFSLQIRLSVLLSNAYKGSGSDNLGTITIN